jgi:hypothetical protein
MRTLPLKRSLHYPTGLMPDSKLRLVASKRSQLESPLILASGHRLLDCVLGGLHTLGGDPGRADRRYSSQNHLFWQTYRGFIRGRYTAEPCAIIRLLLNAFRTVSTLASRKIESNTAGYRISISREILQ